MVIKVMKSAPTSKAPFFYNINKVEQGEAEVMCVRNMSDRTFKTMFRTLLERDAMAIRANKVSAHMVLSGDKGEDLTEEDAISLIDEILAEVGFAMQPYIIFRHYDTKHLHYHIVSTKIKEDGKSVVWNGIGKRTIKALIDRQEKYHYVAGQDLHEKKEKEKLQTPGLTKTTNEVFNDILSDKEITSWEMVIERMRSSGILLTTFPSKHNGKLMLKMQKFELVEKKGMKREKRVGRSIYMKNKQYERLLEKIEEHTMAKAAEDARREDEARVSAIQRIRPVSIEALKDSCTFDEYKAKLDKLGIIVEKMLPQAAGGHIKPCYTFTFGNVLVRGEELGEGLKIDNIEVTLARNLHEQQQKEEARRAVEAKVNVIKRIRPVAIEALKDSCTFEEYKAKLNEFGITAERMLSWSADGNLMPYYTFTSDNVHVKGEELDEGLKIDNIEAMLARNRRERQQKENARRVAEARVSAIKRIRPEAIKALEDSCTFDEYKAKLDKLGITVEKMPPQAAGGHMKPCYTFTLGNVLVRGEELGEELSNEKMTDAFTKNLEERQEEYSKRICSIYYNIIRPLEYRIMEIWESIFLLLKEAQANNVSISGKTHNIHLTSNELLKNRNELIIGRAENSLIDKGKTIAEVFKLQNLWINSAIKLLAQIAADIGKAGIEQKTALVGNIEKIQFEIDALEGQKEQLTEDSIKPIRRYLVVNDCYNEYSQSRATIKDAINSIQSDIKKAKEKEREQTNVKLEKPTNTVVLEYNEGFNKARIIEKDGIYKLQNYGVSFYSKIVNGKKQMRWETKAQFKSFKEIGRANEYLYLRIEEVTGKTRYINQYGNNLNPKILNQLGIGGGKSIHR